ncbi:MAG TPA: hypothetical protein VMW35_22660 [Myxococcota bacterium]|jgi:protein-tyrosine phosphatase|nr:hypothetical protein [Myxococcota bacterium]
MASGIEQSLPVRGGAIGVRLRALAVLRQAAGLALRPDARADFGHEWRRRLRGRARPLPAEVASVLVICHGNICRSPFAAALLARALPELRIASAGLAAEDDCAADAAASRAASRRGVDLGGHRARLLHADHVRGADLVLGMQGRHLRAVVAAVPDAASRAFLLGEFLPDPPHSIPDPWGRDDATFDAVFGRIERAVGTLARALRGQAG